MYVVKSSIIYMSDGFTANSLHSKLNILDDDCSQLFEAEYALFLCSGSFVLLQCIDGDICNI